MITGKKLKKMEEDEHKRYHKRIIYVVIVILLFLFGGATFYHYVEGWRYLNAVYFSASTITTVGYGDITPQTDIGKIFTIFYLFTGVGIVIYGLSVMASHFVEVREEFWLEQIGRIRIKHRTLTLWEKLKNLLFYESGELIEKEKYINKKR